MSEPIFVNGLIFKDPHENAPEFVKGRLSIQVNDFMDFISKHQSNGWVNITMKRAKSGKMYFELDTWKPQNQTQQPPIVAQTPVTSPTVDDVSIENIPY
jgi:hypothetical protein